MFYYEFANRIAKIFEQSIDYMLQHSLKCKWNEYGMGWHEQLSRSEVAGVYASCEGLILLSKRFNGNQNILSSYKTSVFQNNLVQIFDEDIQIAQDSKFLAKYLQRIKSLSSTYKLSKFILATSIFELNNNEKKLQQRTIQKMLNNFNQKTGIFTQGTDSQSDSFMASALAIISLSEIISDKNKLNIYLSGMKDCIKKSECNINTLLSLWALSFCDISCLFDVIDYIVPVINMIILNQIYTKNIIYTEKFVLPSIDIRDSFSVNKQLVFCQTIFNLIDKSIIDKSYVKYTLEYLIDCFSILSKNHVYSENGDFEKILFWENYNLLFSLDQLKNIIFNVYSKEERFMVINPEYFRNSEFTVEKKLVTVIMPFSTEWSDKVYQTFCDALPEYQVWRSKEELKSDAIMQSVWEHINCAELIIADCTGKNANVFYELGIAHTLGKKVFMCAQNREDFPFDINYLRSFLYTKTDEGLKYLSKDLEKFVKLM